DHPVEHFGSPLHSRGAQGRVHRCPIPARSTTARTPPPGVAGARRLTRAIFPSGCAVCQSVPDGAVVSGLPRGYWPTAPCRPPPLRSRTVRSVDGPGRCDPGTGRARGRKRPGGVSVQTWRASVRTASLASRTRLMAHGRRRPEAPNDPPGDTSVTSTIPTAPDTALLPGADPFSHRGSRVGALLCHGFTGSPHSMRPWAEYLVEA